MKEQHTQVQNSYSGPAPSEDPLISSETPVVIDMPTTVPVSPSVSSFSLEIPVMIGHIETSVISSTSMPGEEASTVQHPTTDSRPDKITTITPIEPTTIIKATPPWPGTSAGLFPSTGTELDGTSVDRFTLIPTFGHERSPLTTLSADKIKMEVAILLIF